MKIVFLTQDDPLYIFPFFQQFFSNYGESNEIRAIFACKTMGERGKWRLLKELFHLYGVVGMVKLLFRLVTSKLLGLIPRSRHASKFHTIAQLARAHDVSYYHVANPNRAEIRSQISGFAPDLIVSIACPYILKQDLLRIPPLGCINMHHAPLPRYKGMMPTFWQMYHGERNVAVSIHYMNAKIDEGAILLQEQLPIEAGESLDHLIRRSKRHGAHCLSKVLHEIESESQKMITVDHSATSYFTFPTPGEMKEFRRRGFRAI